MTGDPKGMKLHDCPSCGRRLTAHELSPGLWSAGCNDGAAHCRGYVLAFAPTAHEATLAARRMARDIPPLPFRASGDAIRAALDAIQRGHIALAVDWLDALASAAWHAATYGPEPWRAGWRGAMGELDGAWRFARAMALDIDSGRYRLESTDSRRAGGREDT